VFFDQNGASINKRMPVASGAHPPRPMHQTTRPLGEDVVLQFGGGTIVISHGHSGGCDAKPCGAEAMISRAKRGATICHEGPRFSPAAQTGRR